MAGEIHFRGLPTVRGVEQELRRRRLLAARSYAPRSIPRIAILLGQWDGGEVVIGSGARRAKLTPEAIEAARTPRGGWSRATLASWGVSWPPPKGWKAKLLAKSEVGNG